MEAWLTPQKHGHGVALLLGQTGGAKLHIKSDSEGKNWALVMGDDRIPKSWMTRALYNELGAMKPGRRDHVAATWDGNVMRLFVNGTRVGSLIGNPEGEQPVIPVGSFQLGFDETKTLKLKHGFLGTIDQVRITEGIRYEKDFTPPPTFNLEKGTVGLYRFEEGHGDILKDSSGHEHHGKIIGAKWVTAIRGPVALPASGSR
jgi:hypothetical protein